MAHGSVSESRTLDPVFILFERREVCDEGCGGVTVNPPAVLTKS